MTVKPEGHRCRVLQVSRVRMNPYVRLLQQALIGAGVECSVADDVSPRLVRSWRHGTDVLHIHWLDLLYASPRLRRRLRKLTGVLSGLVTARSEGVGIVCTMHNVSPHEQASPWVDRFAYRILLTLADAVHVHDDEAAVSVACRYGRRRGVYVIPHGSYIGAYPNYRSREESWAWLGMEAPRFAYLCLGQVRRYKGIEELIAAFHATDQGDAQLLLVGNVHDPDYAAHLQQLASGPGILTRFEYVPDEEVQSYMNACDVCVLPYRDVTTSGAAVLAFSFGRPIVAPALGGFPRLVAEGRGITYDPAAERGLEQGLVAVRSLDLASASQAALQWAREHTWDNLAPRFVGV